jgi:hypothetical protein
MRHLLPHVILPLSRAILSHERRRRECTPLACHHAVHRHLCLDQRVLLIVARELASARRNDAIPVNASLDGHLAATLDSVDMTSERDSPVLCVMDSMEGAALLVTQVESSAEIHTRLHWCDAETC